MNLKIQIIGKNSLKGVSGGRLSSWLLAESLAYQGAQVTYTTNKKPYFHREFSSFSKVRLKKSKFSSFLFFSNKNKTKRYHWSIIIPHYNYNDNTLLLKKIWRYAEKTSARTAFFNFETKNFIDDYFYPNNFKMSMWENWKEIASKSDIIISNSGITQEYAKKFYNLKNKKYIFWLTAINNLQIDKIQGRVKKKKQILCITRAEPKKGLDLIHRVLSTEYKGYKLVICIGTGTIKKDDLNNIQSTCDSFGIQLKVLQNVIKTKKAQLLCESEVLLYPSKFESFGMPPLEALYSLLPVVAFDLPSYREFDQGLIETSPLNDVSGMKNKLNHVLRNRDDYVKKIKNKKMHIDKIAKIENSGVQLLKELFKYKDNYILIRSYFLENLIESFNNNFIFILEQLLNRVLGLFNNTKKI